MSAFWTVADVNGVDNVSNINNEFEGNKCRDFLKYDYF